MKRLIVLPLLIAALVAIVACGDGSDDVTGSGSEGALKVYLTDAPLDLSVVSEVRVTLEELVLFPVELQGEEPEDPVRVPVAVTLNLLDYQNGEVVLIADQPVPAGEYERVRMRVTEAVIVWDDDSDPATPDVEEPIFLPSGKVDANVDVGIEVEEGQATTITLDFDAEASVQVNHTGDDKFILRPVVTLEDCDNCPSEPPETVESGAIGSP